MGPTLTIGPLARAAGVGVETIRYYQERALLPVPARGYGYRRYPMNFVERIRFIKRAQELGFTLEEIGELLRLNDGTDRRSIRAIAAARLAQIKSKRTDLARMQRTLRHLIDACENADAAVPCPIIESLASASPVIRETLKNRDEQAQLRGTVQRTAR